MMGMIPAGWARIQARATAERAEVQRLEGGKVLETAIKAELAGITGQTSVPQVFIGGEFIGGCNDGGIGGVMPLKSTGELEQRLIKAGALVPGARI